MHELALLINHGQPYAHNASLGSFAFSSSLVKSMLTKDPECLLVDVSTSASRDLPPQASRQSAVGDACGGGSSN